MHIAIWIVVALGLALWTLTAWGLQALLGLDPNWVGDLKPLVAQLPFGPWLDNLLPGWQGLLVTTMDLLRTLLGWAGGAGQVVVWVVWAVGAGLAVLGGALLSLLVRLGRKAAGGARSNTVAA